MTCTESTNIDIAGLARLLLEKDDFAICGHTSPDGDCIGSTLAMKAILEALGKSVQVLVADDDFHSDTLDFMPGYDDLLFAGSAKSAYPTFICVDVPNEKRAGRFAAKVIDSSECTITIDHHESDHNSTDFRYIDPDSASCTLIIWKLAKELLESCSDEVFTEDVMRDIATCCYGGLLTDTGRFMFQNTNEECFASAKEMVETGIDVAHIASKLFQEQTLASIKLNALASERMEIMNGGRIVISWLSKEDIEAAGATNADTEGCINVIRSLQGALVACMLKDRNATVRGSLRSKDDTDVAAIANEFGGGGHKAAAGFTLECSLQDAIEIVKERLSKIEFSETAQS